MGRERNLREHFPSELTLGCWVSVGKGAKAGFFLFSVPAPRPTRSSRPLVSSSPSLFAPAPLGTPGGEKELPCAVRLWPRGLVPRTVGLVDPEAPQS